VFTQICIPNSDSRPSQRNSIFDPANESCQLTSVTPLFVSSVHGFLIWNARYFRITILVHSFKLVLDESNCVMDVKRVLNTHWEILQWCWISGYLSSLDHESLLYVWSLVSTSWLAYRNYSGSKIVVPVAKINIDMPVRITNANITAQLICFQTRN